MNYKELGYSIEEIHHHCDYEETIAIGHIIECKTGNNYGFIYHYYDYYYNEHRKSKVYQFHKDINFEIPSKTKVIFFKTSSISIVKRLDEYKVYIITEKEEKDAFSHTNHTQTMYRMMDYAEYFIAVDIENSNDLICKVFWPVVNTDEKKITYHLTTVCHSDISSKSILGEYAFVCAYNQYLSYPSMYFLKESIDSIINYVNSINDIDIPDFFSVIDSGYYQCRVGRDDHYNFKKTTTCSSNDKYLRQLTRLKSESVGYYSCIGRDEDDFETINVEETEKLRAEIQSKYSKGEHVIFLISNFLTDVQNKHVETQRTLKNLSSSIKEEDEYLFTTNDCSLNEWEKIISLHNSRY